MKCRAVVLSNFLEERSLPGTLQSKRELGHKVCGEYKGRWRYVCFAIVNSLSLVIRELCIRVAHIRTPSMASAVKTLRYLGKARTTAVPWISGARLITTMAQCSSPSPMSLVSRLRYPCQRAKTVRHSSATEAYPVSLHARMLVQSCCLATSLLSTPMDGWTGRPKQWTYTHSST